ncbi:MAG: nucleotidyltransferase [Actinomycetota bacterium]
MLRLSPELKRNRLGHMVVGGFANYIWGEPRLTTDLDLAINLASAGTDFLVSLVKEMGGRPMPENPVDFAERARVLPIRDREGVRIDFMLATLSFEFDAIGRARPIDIGGAEVPVCRPEDLIVYKLVSERPRDHEDIIGVLRQQRATLDIAELDRVANELSAGMEDSAITDRWASAKNQARI